MRKFLGWLLVLIFATGVNLQSAYFNPMMIGERAQATLMDARNAIADIKQQHMNGASLHEAVVVCKLAFVILMFGFGLQESAHMAKVAWREYRDGNRRKASTALKLALMLILCAGPIGYYGLELVIHVVETIV